MNKIYVVIFAVMVLLGAACSGNKGKAENKKVKVGVSMPTQSLQRWNQDGVNIKRQLTTAGYDVDLKFGGENVISIQISQIEEMIEEDAAVLVIVPIDGKSLTEVLKKAKAKNIAVIAYDRLIMDSDAVSYYATFDNTQVGKMQGQYIADALRLESTAGPYNIELFTGAPEDNNINFFFDGAMSILDPYITSGKLAVKSGMVEKMQCATPNWSKEVSQKRMESLINEYNYRPNGTKLDAVLSSNDSVANGITNALRAAGYTKDNFPVITGQDCDVISVKNIIAGMQSMSVFKDTRTLASRVVVMVEALVNGEEPEINDTQTYNNGIGIVPAYLCEPVVVTIDNYKETLLDSGYYKSNQLR